MSNQRDFGTDLKLAAAPGAIGALVGFPLSIWHPGAAALTHGGIMVSLVAILPLIAWNMGGKYD